MRRITAFLLTVLLSISLVRVLPAQAEMTNDSIKMTVEVGVEKIYKDGAALPLTITLDNRGKKFTGELAINYGFASESGTVVRKKVAIDKNDTTIVHITLDQYNQMMGKNRIKLYKGTMESGELVAYTGDGEIPKPTVSSDAQVMLTVDSSEQEVAALKKLAEKKDSLIYKNRKTFNMPTDEKEMESFSIIVLQAKQLNSWSEEQQAALKKWVEAGGVLYIKGEVESTVFKGLSPFTSSKSKLAATDAQLNKWFGTSDEKYNATFKNMQLQPGAKILVGDKNTPVLASDNLAKGTLVQSSIENENATLAKALNKKVATNFNIEDETEIESVFYKLAEATKTFTAFHFSKAILFAVLLGYILIIAPLLYLLLNRKDKREYAWWIIPLGALITSISLFAFSSKGRFTHSNVQEASIISIDSEKAAQVKFSSSILANKSGDRKVEVPENAGMGLLMNSDNVKEYAKNSTYLLGENNNEFTISNMRYWSIASMIGEYELDDFGALDIQLVNNNGRLTGTIKNNLQYDLKNVTIWSGKTNSTFATLKKGATEKVNVNIEDLILTTPNVDDLLYDEPASKEGIEQYQTGLVENAALINAMKFDKPIITAVINDPVLQLEYKDIQTQMTYTNVIVQPFEPKYEIAKDFVINDDLLNITMEPIGGNQYNEYENDFKYDNEWYIDPGSYMINYQLPPAFTENAITWKELQFRYVPTQALSMEIYNFAAKKYEKIDGKQLLIKKNVSHYVNEQGELQFKMKQINEGDNNVNKPLLQLKGGRK